MQGFNLQRWLAKVLVATLLSTLIPPRQILPQVEAAAFQPEMITTSSPLNQKTITPVKPCVPVAPEPTVFHVIAVVGFDNDLSSLAEEVVVRFQDGSRQNPKVHVTLLVDQAGDGDTRVVEIGGGIIHTLPRIPWLESADELDTASADTLKDFLNWAQTEWPAQRRMVMILGHGAGLTPEIEVNEKSRLPLPQGRSNTSWDVTSGTYLSTPELGRALKGATRQGAAPFDLVFLDQCFGGNLDVLYEIRTTAKVFLASPNYAWSAFVYDRYLAGMATEASNTEIAQRMMEEYETALSDRHPNAIFWVEAAQIEALSGAVDVLGDALQASLTAEPQTEAAILEAALQGQFVDTTLCQGDLQLCPPDEMVGLGSFAGNLQQAFPATSTVALAATEVLSRLNGVHGAYRVGTPWMQTGVTWTYTDTLTILAPLTRTLVSPLIWRHTIYTSTTPLTAVWAPMPTMTVRISNPLAAAVEGRWDDFISRWYTVTTPTVGANCAMMPPLYQDVQTPTLALSLGAWGGLNNIQLSWNPLDSKDISHFRVWRAISGTMNFEALTVTARLDYADWSAELITGTAYCYRVDGLFPGGMMAAASNVSCATFGELGVRAANSWGESGQDVILPINIRNAEGLKIAAADFWLNFDPRVIQPVSVTHTALTDQYEWTAIVSQTATQGQIRISTVADPFHVPTLHGAGGLFWIYAHVVGQEGMTSTLDLQEFITGTGGSAIYTPADVYAPVAMRLRDGVFRVGGAYQLGDLNGDKAVLPIDAYIGLAIAGGLMTPTVEQVQAGDINGDDLVEVPDAALVYYHSRYKNWPVPDLKKKEGAAAAGSLQLSVDSVGAIPGGFAETVVRAQGLADWTGAEIVLKYNPGYLEVVSVQAVGLGAGFELLYRKSGSLLVIEMAKDLPVSGNGVLCKIRFRVSQTTPIGKSLAVNWVDARLNDLYGRDYEESSLNQTLKLQDGIVMVQRSAYMVYMPLVAKGAVPHGVVADDPTTQVEQDWLAGVQAEIERSEYNLSAVAADGSREYQAPNRAQNLRTYFGEQGIRVTSRISEAAWSLALTVGHPEGQPVFQENEARYTEGAAGMTVTYLNEESGLKQQIVLEKPVARGVEVDWDGDLQAVATEGAVEFKTADGAGAVRYGEIRAWAADGRALPVKLEVVEGQVSWRFEAGAEDYPVVLEALLTSPAGVQSAAQTPARGYPDWTYPGNQPDTSFGGTISSAGDVNGDGYCDVLVGQALYGAGEAFDENGQFYEGRVYLFYGSELGLKSTPDWIAEGNKYDLQFGSAVSSAGDVNGDGYSDVIISAVGYSNGEYREGQVFAYYGSATGLRNTPDWMVESNVAESWFGFSVDGAGDVNGDGYDDIIVGAPWLTHGQEEEGAVYVYYGSRTGLESTPAWGIEGNSPYRHLGYWVVSAGDVNHDGYGDVAVGNYESSGSGSAVSVYYGSAIGLQLTPDWQTQCSTASCGMGFRIGAAGDVNKDGYDDLIVSSYVRESSTSVRGRYQLFMGSAVGLASTAAWSVEGTSLNDNSAASVSRVGDFNGDGYDDIIIGWPPLGSDGGVWMYFGSATGLSPVPNWTSDVGGVVSDLGDVNGDGFGDIMIGAPFYWINGAYTGKVFLYYGRSMDFLSDTQLLNGRQDFSYFGYRVKGAGDVNQDGFDDVIVGAYLYDNGQLDEGRAYLYYGSDWGVNSEPAWAVEGNQIGGWFGYDLDMAGDVNGDGYADVLISGPHHSNDQYNEGRVYGYYGSALGLRTTPDWIVESHHPGSDFGASVSAVGDVNQDGYDDVLIGADAYGDDIAAAGKVYLYYGSAQGLKLTPAWSVEGTQAGARLGRVVNGAGDVNGDGYADVIIAGPGYDNNGAVDSGAVYVYHGSPIGLKAVADWKIVPTTAGRGMGQVADTAGDVNGDGYADVVVGEIGYDNGQTDEGRVSVYYGSAQGVQSMPAWSMEGNQVYAGFALAGGGMGDMNGDGYDDLLVGIGNYDHGQTDEGAVQVYYGSPDGLELTPGWGVESQNAGAYFGAGVGAAGDINGDGYADAVVGAPEYTTVKGEVGRVYVLYGHPYLSRTVPGVIDGDQSDAGFGLRLTGVGDVNRDGYGDVLVGAPAYDNGETDEGRVYLYYGSATGLLTAPGWMAEGNQVTVGLGSSVSGAGDVNKDGYADVVVGAPGYAGVGRIYGYYGSPQGLKPVPDWTVAGSSTGTGLGTGVAGAGDVNKDGYADVLVSAPTYTGNFTGSGKVYLYYGSAQGLSGMPAWSAEGDRLNAGLGTTVNPAGDVNRDGYADVILGAELYASNGITNTGAVYVYYGSATGLKLTADWQLVPSVADQYLGSLANKAGDVNGDGFGDVVIGSRGYTNGQAAEGKVEVYYGSATGLGATAAWSVESDQADSGFAAAGGAAGDVNKDGYGDLILGADRYDSGQIDEGVAWIYYGSATGLKATPDWSLEGEQTGGRLGVATVAAGDVNGDGHADALIGAGGFTAAYDQAGRAVIAYGHPDRIYPAFSVLDGDQSLSGFGSVVAPAWDVNKDGFADVFVGAPFYDNPNGNAGKVYFYYGSAQGPQIPSAWILNGGWLDSWFGYSLSSAGDVNHDGYVDVVVGAPYEEHNLPYAVGRVYGCYGSSRGVYDQGNWGGEEYESDANFGVSMAGVGDVNGDGYDDVVIGANDYHRTTVHGGKVFLYYGSATGLNTWWSWNVYGGRNESRFGVTVNPAGDVNHDGYADVIVGNDNYAGKGAAFVYYGSATGLKQTPDWRMVADSPGCLGRLANTAGDVNGDGYDDVIVGGPCYDNGQIDEGKVFVFYGSATGLKTTPAWSAESNQGYSEFAVSGGTVGDMNNDGYDDVIIGASRYDHGQNGEGAIWIYYGSATGLNSVPAWVVESDQAGAHFGASVAAAGDLNGDGYDDAVVGAPEYFNAVGYVGRIYIFYGRP